MLTESEMTNSGLVIYGLILHCNLNVKKLSCVCVMSHWLSLGNCQRKLFYYYIFFYDINSSLAYSISI